MSLAKMSQDVSDICVGRAVLLVGCKIQSFARLWMFDSDQAAEKEVQGEPVGPPRKNSLQNALPLGLASLAPPSLHLGKWDLVMPSGAVGHLVSYNIFRGWWVISTDLESKEPVCWVELCRVVQSVESC